MRVVVDELPCGCASCLFYAGFYCPLLRERAPDSHTSRLKGCPLVTLRRSLLEIFSNECKEEFYEFTEED